MKIIHILCGKANPKTTMNGVNVVVDRYASVMYEKGYDVEVWGIANNPITNLPSPKYPIRFFQQYHSWPCKLDKQLIECLKKIDTAKTIVNFHGGFIKEFSRIAKHVKGLKYFVIPHGAYSDYCTQKNNKWKKTVYYHLVEKYYLNASQGVLVFSEEVGALVRKYMVSEQYLISKEPDPAFNANCICNKKANQQIIWGYCGRINNQLKAVDKFIKCFLVFSSQRKNENHILSIIGDGPDLEDIRHKYIDEISAGSIQIHGQVMGQDKLEKYLEMDYFEHISNTDCKPLACIDAIGLGIPVIITPATGLVEDVEKYNAGVITGYAEEEIIQSLHEMLQKPRNEMVDGCLRMIKEKYNSELIFDKLVSLYERALS